MARSSWNWFVPYDDPAIGGRTHRRSELSVQCEALDSRQLLSTVAPAAAELSVPPATVAVKAATILESVAPRAFARFQTALTRAEEQSHVNLADVTAWPRTRRLLTKISKPPMRAARTMFRTGLITRSLMGLMEYETCAGTWFHYSEVSKRLDKIVEGAPAVFSASGSGGSTSPIDQLTDQIKVVAMQAKVKPAVQSALNRSYSALNKALGPHPYVSLGPGADNVRDPLVVYYDAQVENFMS